MANSEVRLQKFMADNGIASRRKSEELIAAGKVKVNGHKAFIGQKIHPKKDIVSVQGKKIVKNDDLYYIMLNKPRGYVTTTKDELGRKCVNELVKDIAARLYPVGRLDRESEGLLFLTNDGEFTNALTHPSHGVRKTYRVTVKPVVEEYLLQKLENGVEIDGKKTAPCMVKLLEKQEDRMFLEFIISEGRNRQIRKMCESIGTQVIRLKRTAEGDVKLGGLPVGQWRHLETKEIKKLAGPAIAQKAQMKQVRK
ncbi:MAG: rRNA pseudouridine synthase [Ruminococcaceae bacterium]|nr:rRNA pseudouridine synthase [Oscillospiraceae bacterium]